MFNLATLFAETGNVVKATEMMHKVLQLQPEDPDNYKTLAILLFKQDKNQEAIAEYMKCIHREPLHADCYCGMGNAFVRIGKYDEAQEAYTAAANINPNEAGYSNNIGNLLVRHHRFNHTAQQLAIKYLKNSVSLDGTYADGYFNLGEAYSAVSQYDFAVNAIKLAMKLDPNRQDYKCTLHLDMRKLCDWTDFEEYKDDLERMWQYGIPDIMKKKGTYVPTRKPGQPKSRRREYDVTICPNPLESLSYELSLNVLRHIAEAHGQEARTFVRNFQRFPLNPLPMTDGVLRVGYVSIELRDRPVGKDMVYAFRAHDPSKVSLICFSLNPNPREGVDSEETLSWHRKMKAECKGGYLDLSSTAFYETASAINREQPHVLINLDGWTSAPLINEIFILSPAPIQLSFKGFPGTTGIAEHHGIVADRKVIPPEFSEFYVERLVYMPHSYHYNGHDSLYAHLAELDPSSWPSRAELAGGSYFMKSSGSNSRKPEFFPADAIDSFILCNFNQFYKITPKVWQLWMHLLGQVPDSKLWLLSWNEAGKQSLLRYAKQSGIPSDKLIFTTFFEEKWHVASKANCDLFVDTRPYAAHGTAADALFAGLPIISAPGESMASRVSLSLSLASGIGDLFIARNDQDYVRLAQHFALKGRKTLRSLKQAMQRSAIKSAAFDSARWASNFISGLRMMYDAFVMEGAVHNHHILHDAGTDHNAAAKRDTLQEDAARSSVHQPSQSSSFQVRSKSKFEPPKSSQKSVRGSSKYSAPPAFPDERAEEKFKAKQADNDDDDDKKKKKKAPPRFSHEEKTDREKVKSAKSNKGRRKLPSWTSEDKDEAKSRSGWKVPSEKVRLDIPPRLTLDDKDLEDVHRDSPPPPPPPPRSQPSPNKGKKASPNVKIPGW
uniref:protein O-GlcNAc transferase n=1 Tax=Guillardia theta TaxID=55529 RepID=A0A7S4PJS0_GUITH